jgi:hypothetical protein
LLAQKGYRFDCSISGIDPRYGLRSNVTTQWNSPMGYGYVNGSGQPMKVITPEGMMVDLFCQLTQFEDDVAARDFLVSPPNDSVTTRRLIDVSTSFIDRSINNYHSVLVWNFHPEHTIQRWPPEAPTTGAWIQATVGYLKQHHVPMLSVNEWLAFVQARRSIVLTGMSYDTATTTGAFTLTSHDDINGLALMIPLPARFSEKRATAVSFVAAGKPPTKARFQTKVFNGMQYLVLSIDVRAREAVSVSYRLL